MRVADDSMALAFREVEHRAVLCDDCVEAFEIACDPSEFGEPSARYEHDRDAVDAQVRDRVAHEGIERVVFIAARFAWASYGPLGRFPNAAEFFSFGVSLIPRVWAALAGRSVALVVLSPE
jgi:hypothetical protein